MQLSVSREAGSFGSLYYKFNANEELREPVSSPS